GDYGAAAAAGPLAADPYYYNSVTSTSTDPIRPIVMNRPFRSVGEMGYAFRDQPFKTLDFSSSTSSDNGLLDLFTVNENDTANGITAGVINLNTAQDAPVSAILAHSITAQGMDGGTPSPSSMPNTSASRASPSL